MSNTQPFDNGAGMSNTQPLNNGASMSNTQTSNSGAGMSYQGQGSSDRQAPDPSGYDPEVYKVLYTLPDIAQGEECPAYYDPLNLPVPEDEFPPEPEDEFSLETEDKPEGERGDAFNGPANSPNLQANSPSNLQASDILNGPTPASGEEVPAHPNPLRMPRRTWRQ